MRWLLFLSRLAFICNCCFLLALSIQLWDWLPSHDLSSTIAVLGYYLVYFVNPVAVLCYGLLLLFRRPLRTVVPLWLIIANTVFCIIELYILFSFYDQ